jgi:PAS domain S-box-containing protein
MIFEANSSTILVIDNFLREKDAVLNFFENDNYHVVTAKSGEQGLRDAQQLMPDLILLDVNLPDIDGFEICRRLKQNDTLRDIPVIFMTSKKSTGYMASCFKAGGVDCVVKPLQGDELMVRVYTQLKLHRLEQKNTELEQRLRKFIDEKKQLQVSEHLYQSLLESHPDGIIRLNPQGRHLYISQQALDMTGTELSSLSLLGKTVCELPIPGNPELMQPLLDSVLKISAAATADTIEFTWCNGNVSEIRLIPELNEQGEVSSVLAIARDVTALKLSKMSLDQEKTTLKTFFDTIPSMLWVKDIEGRYFACNSFFEVFFNTLAVDIIGKTYADFVKTNLAAFLLQKYKEAIAARTPTINQEWCVCASDGQEVLLEVTKAPLIDKYGKMIGILGIGHDLTAIKDLEDQLHTMLDNLPDVIVRYDRQCKRIYVNPEFEKVTGISAENALGQDPYEFIQMASIENDYSGKIKAIFKHGKADRFEIYLLNCDGSRMTYDLRAIPEYNKDGVVSSLLTIARNITELKQAEYLYKAKERELFTLIENSPDIIVRYDRDCRLTFFNKAYRLQAGTPVGYALNSIDTVGVWRPTIPAEEYHNILQQVMSTGVSDKILLEWKDDYGVCVSHEMYVAAEYGSNGMVIGALAVGRDFSDHKRMEEEITYRENKFRTLAENSPNVIIRYNFSLRCVYINPSYMKANGITHLEKTDEISTKWQSALDEYNYILQEVITTGEDAEFVLKIPGENDERFSSYAINVVAERKPDGQVLGVLVIAHDITSIKNIEDRLTQSHEQLRGLAARLVTIKEEQIKNITREMHDELGQYLTALRMGIGVLKMHSKDHNPLVLNQLNDLKGLVDHIILVVRDVVERMRPSVLDMGINFALEWLKSDFNKRTGVICSLRTNKKEIVLNDNYATAIFRMVQESLTNITRHAQANQVKISFIDQNNHYVLEVIDDGKGFDPSIIHAKSFGLTGLRERVIMLDGEFNIISELNVGTTVSVKIPYRNNKTKALKVIYDKHVNSR